MLKIYYPIMAKQLADLEAELLVHQNPNNKEEESK